MVGLPGSRAACGKAPLLAPLGERENPVADLTPGATRESTKHQQHRCPEGAPLHSPSSRSSSVLGGSGLSWLWLSSFLKSKTETPKAGANANDNMQLSVLILYNNQAMSVFCSVQNSLGSC